MGSSTITHFTCDARQVNPLRPKLQQRPSRRTFALLDHGLGLRERKTLHGLVAWPSWPLLHGAVGVAKLDQHPASEGVTLLSARLASPGHSIYCGGKTTKVTPRRGSGTSDEKPRGAKSASSREWISCNQISRRPTRFPAADPHTQCK